jgi:hypothetical protein
MSTTSLAPFTMNVPHKSFAQMFQKYKIMIKNQMGRNIQIYWQMTMEVNTILLTSLNFVNYMTSYDNFLFHTHHNKKIV